MIPLFRRWIPLHFALWVPLAACACTQAPPAQSSPAQSSRVEPVENPRAEDGGEPPVADAAEVNEEPASSGDESPASVWSRFVADWNGQDAQKLATWSAPQGVLLLDNPGAFVRVTRLADAPALREQPGDFDGARIQKLSFSAALDPGEVPSADCAKTPEVSPGTFLGDTDGQRISKFIEAMGTYDLAPADEVKKLRETWAASSAAKRFVVSDTKQSVAFYFGVSGSKVSLVAVDAVIPCSA